MNALKILVIMQLKDKLDLSFLKSRRDTVLKSVLFLIKIVVITAVFWALFFLCNMFSVFRPAGKTPDTALNVLFVAIQLMSIVTCTVGLTQALYLTADNKVLLTFPVKSTTVFASKLLLYYIFEIKRALTFVAPLFVAYGIANGAVWYYYLWLIPCFFIIALVPVALGTVLSLPSLLVATVIRRYRNLQLLFGAIGVAALTFLVIVVIKAIPPNIDIMGQWGSIFVGIQNFLNSFARYTYPYYKLTQMVVGGTLRISGVMIRADTAIILVVTLAALAAMFGLSFLLARPLFVKMVSRQFEYETRSIRARRNKKLNPKLSPFVETLQMNFRSGKDLLYLFAQLVFPAITTLFINQLYAAMNTSYSGQIMTKAFNLLIMAVLTLAFNNPYASVYSREGIARDIIKTRPEPPIITLTARIVPRMAAILLSTVAVMTTYMLVSSAERSDIVLMCLITLFISEGHLLMCADLDVTHSYADQYQTVGVEFDSPNNRIATVAGFIIGIGIAAVYFLFSAESSLFSLLRCLFIALAFFAVRIVLYVRRIRVFFVE